jgi:hypothetical protein
MNGITEGDNVIVKFNDSTVRYNVGFEVLICPE